MKQTRALMFVFVVLLGLLRQLPAQAGPIVTLAADDYIINIDSRVYGAPWEGHPLSLVLTLGPGRWLVSPTNPSINTQALYTAWSWYGGGFWTTHIGVANLNTGEQYYRTKGTPAVVYTSPNSAYYDDPLNISFTMDVAQSTQFAFYTGDSRLDDNAGGASLHVIKLEMHACCSPDGSCATTYEADCSGSWMVSATCESLPCTPIATDRSTWGTVKGIYR